MSELHDHETATAQEDPRDAGSLFGGWLPRFQHIERLGHRAVQGILDPPYSGLVIQEKLDGANVTIACSDPVARTGLVICSRNRVLHQDGFTKDFFKGLVPYVLARPAILEMAKKGIIRAEWLIQHSIADYDKDRYGHLYVFDVQDYEDFHYFHTLTWIGWIHDALEIMVAPTICVDNLTPEGLAAASLGPSVFGAKQKEGLVVKKYGSWRNCFGRVTWAKIVAAEFKEKNGLHFTPQKKDGPEIAAASQLVTKEQVMKVIHKIEDDKGEVSVRNMAEVLGRVFDEVVHEELLDWILKKKVDEFSFGQFRRLLTTKARDIALGHFNGIGE